jgi:hypothetical protein
MLDDDEFDSDNDDNNTTASSVLANLSSTPSSSSTKVGVDDDSVITRTITRLAENPRTINQIDAATSHQFVDGIISLIIEYQLPFDSIAQSLEQQVQLCYAPLLSNINLINNFNMAIGAKFMDNHHDSKGICLRLTRLAYQHWVLATEYDEPSTRGRAWYKRSSYHTFGLKVCSVDKASILLAISYARKSKHLGFLRSYVLLVTLSTLVTKKERDTLELNSDDIAIPEAIRVRDPLCAAISSMHQSKSIQLMDAVIRDPTDQLLMYLLAQTKIDDSFPYWVVVCAQRGHALACHRLATWYYYGDIHIGDRLKPPNNNDNEEDDDEDSQEKRRDFLQALRWCCVSLSMKIYDSYDRLCGIVLAIRLYHPPNISYDLMWSIIPESYHQSVRHFLATHR